MFNSSFLRLGDDAIWRILISFAPHSFGCFRLPEHSFLELPLEICLIHISQQRFAVESHEFVRDRTERSAVSSLFSASRPRLSRQQNLHMWYYLKRISLQFLFFQNKKWRDYRISRVFDHAVHIIPFGALSRSSTYHVVCYNFNLQKIIKIRAFLLWFWDLTWCLCIVLQCHVCIVKLLITSIWSAFHITIILNTSVPLIMQVLFLSSEPIIYSKLYILMKMMR